MKSPSDAQWDYLWILHDRLKARDGSDLRFYELLEQTTGRRTTVDLSSMECSKMIDALKEELE